jgi:hypothetical protein
MRDLAWLAIFLFLYTSGSLIVFGELARRHRWLVLFIGILAGALFLHFIIRGPKRERRR